MQIVVPPPSALLYFALALPLGVGLVLLLAARGKPLAHKLVALAIAVLASGIVLYAGYRPLKFGWDEQGIRDETFRAPVTVPWGDIVEARLVPDFWRSEYRPTLRTNGTAYADVRAGWFRLANGETHRLFALGAARDALLVRTASATYLYAPAPFEPFVAAVRAHTGMPAGP